MLGQFAWYILHIHPQTVHCISLSVSLNAKGKVHSRKGHFGVSCTKIYSILFILKCIFLVF